MIRLMVIADDLTGAMDTGVQFSQKGIKTLVSVDVEINLDELDSKIAVLVVDTESRHLTGREASERVFRIAKAAKRANVPYVFKKTDSTLRGNIGSELQAVMDAWGCRELMFVPAYPANGRTTVNGRQYVHGVPLEESAFGSDPLEPIRDSDIRQILKQQCTCPSVVISLEAMDRMDSPNAEADLENGNAARLIRVFDSQSQDELNRVVEKLKEGNHLHVTAGCAGMASALAESLDIQRRKTQECPFSGKMLTICGSLNEASLAQVAYAEEHGFDVIRLTPEQKLSSALRDSDALLQLGVAILRRMDDGRKVVVASAANQEEIKACDRLARSNHVPMNSISRIIAESMAELVWLVAEKQPHVLPVIFGGDTAIAVVKRLGNQTMIPLREILPGTVLSEIETGRGDSLLITKAGGFGPENILLTIRDAMED